MSDLKDQEKPRDNVEEEKIIATSVTDFMEKLKEYTSDTKTPTSNYLYRGLTNSTWNIKSTDHIRFEKHIKNKTSNKSSSPSLDTNQKRYNQSLVKYFKHEFFEGYKDSYQLDNDLAILAQLRHHNAATALIDFSGNPLVSLWFACQENQEEVEYTPETDDPKLIGKQLYYKEKTDGAVHIINIDNDKIFIKIHSKEQLDEYKIEVIYDTENSNKWFYWKPAHLNKRIPAQSSYFVIGKNNIPENNINKIIIPHLKKESILQELANIYGIDSITLFPDMHGFADANSHDTPYSTDAKYRTIIKDYFPDIKIT